MHTFAESFTHHVDLLWSHGGGLSWNMIHTNEDFQQYVRGFQPRARFPSHRVLHRLPQVVLELHRLERKQYISSLEKNFRGKECIGLQLDMWTNTDSVQREQYACVIMTTVTEPEDATALGAQLRLRSDILDFNVFPNSEKTGDNIKSWLMQVLVDHQIKHSMVSGITTDGAADGQCGLRLIDTLRDKVDTCMLHQL